MSDLEKEKQELVKYLKEMGFTEAGIRDASRRVARYAAAAIRHDRLLRRTALKSSELVQLVDTFFNRRPAQ